MQNEDRPAPAHVTVQQFGKALEALIDARGLTKSATAQRAELTRAYVGQLCRGRGSKGKLPRPGFDVVRRLAGVLGVPITYFDQPESRPPDDPAWAAATFSEHLAALAAAPVSGAASGELPDSHARQARIEEIAQAAALPVSYVAKLADPAQGDHRDRRGEAVPRPSVLTISKIAAALHVDLGEFDQPGARPLSDQIEVEQAEAAPDVRADFAQALVDAGIRLVGLRNLDGDAGPVTLSDDAMRAIARKLRSQGSDGPDNS